MNSNPKLACAIAAILTGTSMGLAHADTSADTSDSEGIQEITVTAQRRSESLQDVPITIQAIPGAQLKELSLSTFDDVVKYLPNVTFPSNGPGQGNIYMRGLSTGFAGNQSSATIAPFPNVAVYLDDESMQFPARNLDIYMVDMERLEVLEGPQGTLFGGGAEAGAVRYITNKPKLDVTEGSVDASYGTTANGGGNNSSVNAVLNLPLIADTLAVRGVIYNDQRGGYIDNVPSTFTRKNTDLGVTGYGAYAAGCQVGTPTNGVCAPVYNPAGKNTNPGTGFIVPPNSPVGNNYNVAQTQSNPVTYSGFRLSALYKFNDNWNALLAQSYQNINTQGEFAQYPTGSDGQTLGPDQITAFSPAYDKDHYENTALTVNGQIGFLKAVYDGSYLVRHIEQQEDYTNYSRSAGGFYYACTGGGVSAGTLGAGNGPAQCYSPVSSWNDTVRNTHQSHEIRVSTPDDLPYRGLFGAYWEDFEIQDVMNFNYKSIPSCTPDALAAALAGGPTCVANVATPPGSTATDPGIRGDSTAFGEDAQRGYKQTAFFLSADYDIIPKVLTITGGTRYYTYSEFETGSQYGTSTGCVNVPNGCIADTHNINAENLHTTYNGFKSRGNITWHVTPDTMVYYTYSQGFRPGAFNRTTGAVAKDADGNPQLEKPSSYAPDSLTNQEIGVKSEFFNHRIQVNASAYHMNWTDVQVLFFNPVDLGNTTFGTNGPNYRINGVELQVVGKVTDAFTVQGSGSYNHSVQTNSPCLVGNIPGSPTFGQCITEVKGVPFANPFGAPGGAPANSPALQANLRGRYDYAFNDYKTFIMAGGNFTGSSYNQVDTAISGDNVAIPTTTLLRYEMPHYLTCDASVGVSKDQWTAQLFGQNLTNSNASTFTSSAQFIKSEVPLRPRVLGLKFGYKF
jgi:iron complex outermembrane receptor protein